MRLWFFFIAYMLAFVKELFLVRRGIAMVETLSVILDLIGLLIPSSVCDIFEWSLGGLNREREEA